jgi:hypothetical protein
MKSFFGKIVLLAFGIVAFFGINLKDVKAFQHYSNISEISSTTPLFLQHANDISPDRSVLNWHSSHYSHGSHGSHESHSSHYSHYSGR